MKINLIEMTNIYIQQNKVAQNLTEEEFVKKYIYTLEKISEEISKYKNEKIKNYLK